MKPYLLFVRAGKSLPLCLLDYQSDPEIELVVSEYEAPSYILPGNPIIQSGGKSKFDAARIFFESQPEYLNVKIAAFFDPDLEISFWKIKELFHYGVECGSALYQAALTSDSYGSWPHVFQRSEQKYRKTTFVEVMAPFMDRKLLRSVWPYFSDSISTWGQEYIWYSKAKRRKIHVIDLIAMKHVSPIDIENGAFYKYLRSMLIDPWQEKKNLRRIYCDRFYLETDCPHYAPFFLIPEWLIFKVISHRAKTILMKLTKKLT